MELLLLLFVGAVALRAASSTADAASATKTIHYTPAQKVAGPYTPPQTTTTRPTPTTGVAGLTSTKSETLSGSAFASYNSGGTGLPLTDADLQNGIAIYAKAKQRYYLMSVSFFTQMTAHWNTSWGDALSGIEGLFQLAIGAIASGGVSAVAAASALTTAAKDAQTLNSAALTNLTEPIDPATAPNFYRTNTPTGANATTGVVSVTSSEIASVENQFILADWTAFVSKLQATYGAQPTPYVTMKNQNPLAGTQVGDTLGIPATVQVGGTPYYLGLVSQIRNAYVNSPQGQADYQAFLGAVVQATISTDGQNQISYQAIQGAWRLAPYTTVADGWNAGGALAVSSGDFLVATTQAQRNAALMIEYGFYLEGYLG